MYFFLFMSRYFQVSLIKKILYGTVPMEVMLYSIPKICTLKYKYIWVDLLCFMMGILDYLIFTALIIC